MIKKMIWKCGASTLLPCAFFLGGCSDKSTGPKGYDLEGRGIPRFVRVNYINPAHIARISRFRSAAGHSYSDDFEHCRSMKHYFWPKGGEPGATHVPSWSTIAVSTPVSGTVANVFDEWAGTQVWITSSEYPDFQFRIFHVGLADSLYIGDPVSAGQLLGNNIGDQTMQDIAVGVNTTKGWKHVSYFDVMTDSLFQTYETYGITSREQLIISKAERDADSLTCEGESYTSTGHLADWVELQ